MPESVILMLFGVVLSLASAWPLGKLLERHLNRQHEKLWREVQERTRTKGVVVGSLRSLRKSP